MSPDQVGVLTAVLTILERLGGMPLYIIIMVVEVGPWFLVFVFVRYLERRFEATRKMYEDNVVLVKNYEKIANGLIDCVTMNTIKWTEVADKIDTNQFCPLSRIRKQRMEDMHP